MLATRSLPAMKMSKAPLDSAKPIFVSHAGADKEIADCVVDLLNTGLAIDVQQMVFCSSLEGMKIPPGQDFKEFIRQQIQEPKIVILLISQNYLSSPFCLAELGASWAMSHRVLPLIIPPTTSKDMRGVLAGLETLQIEDSSDWNEAFDVFRKVLQIDPNVNRWERKRDEHLARLEKLIKKQKPPATISLAKFEALQERLEAANAEIGELERKLDDQTSINAQLKTAKDAKDVARIELNNLDASKKFRKLVTVAKRNLSPLPSIVCEALYYHFRSEHLNWGGFGEDSKNDDITSALERGLLADVGDGLKVKAGNPKVRRAIEALEALEYFVGKESEEMAEAYVEEHDEELSFSTRDFWERNLF